MPSILLRHLSSQAEANNKLLDVAFDWQVIRKHANKLLFVHADDDPYVPLDQAQYVADNCKAAMIILPGQGHFNLEKSETYRSFPKLIRLMERKGIV